jgi:hypothetical protein
METLLVKHKQEELPRTFMYSANTDVVHSICSVCGIGANLPPNSTKTTTMGKGSYSFTLGS